VSQGRRSSAFKFESDVNNIVHTDLQFDKYADLMTGLTKEQLVDFIRQEATRQHADHVAAEHALQGDKSGLDAKIRQAMASADNNEREAQQISQKKVKFETQRAALVGQLAIKSMENDAKANELAAIRDVKRGLEEGVNKELKGIDKKTFDKVSKKVAQAPDEVGGFLLDKLSTFMGGVDTTFSKL